MADLSWTVLFQRYRFFAIGFVCAITTSLPVLDPKSLLWSNDEGYFFGLGQSGSTLLDPRYGAFSLLIFLYFQITQFPFAVALIHKALMLSIFLFFFQKKLLEDRGTIVFSFLFISFLYLNSYFLRDSLIFIFCLLAITYGASDRTLKGLAGLIPLALLRPQVLLLFLRPWVSILILIGFIAFSRHLFAAAQLRDNGNLSLIHAPFWEDTSRYVLSAVANLNPLPKARVFIEHGLFLEYGLLVLASIPLFAVLAQMTIALVLTPFRFPDFLRVWVGLACMLVLYGTIGISADVRVLYAAVCPFFIYAHKSLLRWRYLAALAAILASTAALKDAAKLALGVVA